MSNYLLIIATGVQQGIGKNWHPVECPCIADGRCQIDCAGSQAVGGGRTVFWAVKPFHAIYRHCHSILHFGSAS
jgi:hypothetical protein